MAQTLRKFLEARVASSKLERDAWLEKVRELLNDIREWMHSYEPLQLEDWNLLVVEGGEKYNVPALTIQFQHAQITIQPVGAERRIEAVCGARAAYLEWTPEGWQYRLDEATPGIRTGTAPSPSDWKSLTAERFADEVVQGLLA